MLSNSRIGLRWRPAVVVTLMVSQQYEEPGCHLLAVITEIHKMKSFEITCKAFRATCQWRIHPSSDVSLKLQKLHSRETSPACPHLCKMSSVVFVLLSRWGVSPSGFEE